MANRAVTDPSPSDGEPDAPRCAVAYVRMSTDHQRYSTENQLDAIRRFATQRNIEILRTYEDAGKSGLRLDGREALLRLIEEIKAGRPDFGAILVYDVSRWGRFQDADESAYYEHICKRAGVAVHYCAEQFENDGSIGSNVLKAVKRVMAGEYSRELSVKVFAGQCRLIELGFRQGGMPGLGLRRLLIDEAHNPKKKLQRGERKSLQTDRVTLIAGPAGEVETVRRVYRLFVEAGKPECEIAAILNAEGVLSDLVRPWTRGTIHQLLTNEKYIGNNVFNRTSAKLKGRRIANDRSLWVRSDGAFESIVDAALFAQAQSIIQARSQSLNDTEMLELLRRVLSERGWLSGMIIDERDDMPSSSAYRTRFGSLLRAYELVGFSPGRDYRYLEINRALRRMHPDIVAQVVAGVQDCGGEVSRHATTDLLTINAEFTASVVIARCLRTPGGSLRWKIRLDTGLLPDVTVAVRMDAPNRAPLDYYVLPRIDMVAARLRLAEDNGLGIDAYRFETLAFFFSMAARARLREVA